MAFVGACGVGVGAVGSVASGFVCAAAGRCVVSRSRTRSVHGARFSRRVCTQQLSMKVQIEDALKSPKWPEQWPFKPQDFQRQDESIDSYFYSQPRLVTHIDDDAIDALTKYYAKEIKPGSDVLDLCSSWISHYPEDLPLNKVVGLGMNKYELEQNKRLTSFDVVDLNRNPMMPYPDNSFDVITNVVSVDYLVKPLEIFKEMARVLRPGGKAIMSFSNRCFPTKVSAIWLRTNDAEHVFIVGSFFHYAGEFEPPKGIDISPRKLFGRSDPMYIVQATKKKLAD
ncbi:Demethylmenaquinone methyltransferase [Porphyridium purpureum]|uniref:Demethylmenaquinone methyltransferase n=1 Tax=Porphyridium purpureum TaxID=35688 RepID=A0A5J4Z6M0_PORPP|nr:Demethylmenaquinone methyltransferase [Porphyridium purpureum]|eukprot:POR4485..scf295_1